MMHKILMIYLVTLFKRFCSHLS